MNELTDKKICVGLSGGVDSSVAALLLKRAGCDVFALFMQNWNDASTTLHGDCEWEEERFVAEMAARKIGIPFYFVDLSTEYHRRVTDYMFAEYAKGRTPNPDVLCNSEIKFDAFLQCARKLGADLVATGHYCRKELVPVCDGTTGAEVEVRKESDGTGKIGEEVKNEIGMKEGKEAEYKLLAGTDGNKDQSYFLCRLSQEQLAAAVFPIGDLTKPEVRRIAREADLPSADRKDSQGLCFVGKVNLPTFLRQALNPGEGDVIEVYDAYYADNEEYRWQTTLLDSITDKSISSSLHNSEKSEERPDNSENKDDINSLKTGSKLDVKKIGELSDEDLERLARPILYNIEFETETYRSGKRHVKKTRYKENPYGRIAGRHIGACYYTIGQRRGLAIGGHRDPLFVIATDTARNIVYMGEGEDHKGLHRSCLRILPEEIHWMRPSAAMQVGEFRRYKVRIRYRQPLQDAVLVMRPSGLYILFDEPQRGVTPGQFAVWYDGPELIGSGPISQ
ncbi:MAG: tRNA-specific 2-thiouridylase [Bacteroidales bacterium]|nr:tRNA-specific 2-thiouridylase [Bacteroidales bacterium]